MERSLVGAGLDPSLHCDRKSAQPGFQVSNVEGAGIEHLHHFRVDLHRRAVQAPTVDAKEHVGRGECDAFVAIHEGMVDGQALEQCSRFSDDIFVAASLRPEERRLQGARSTAPVCGGP